MLADTGNRKHKRFKLIIILFYGFLLLFCVVTYISDKLATGVFASAPIDLSKPSEVTLDYFIWFPGKYELVLKLQKRNSQDFDYIKTHLFNASNCRRLGPLCIKYQFFWELYQDDEVQQFGVSTEQTLAYGGWYARDSMAKGIIDIHLSFGWQKLQIKYKGGLETFVRFKPTIKLLSGGLKSAQSNLAGLLIWGNVFAMLFIWPFLVLSLIVNNIIWLYKKSKNRK